MCVCVYVYLVKLGAMNGGVCRAKLKNDSTVAEITFIHVKMEVWGRGEKVGEGVEEPRCLRVESRNHATRSDIVQASARELYVTRHRV